MKKLLAMTFLLAASCWLWFAGAEARLVSVNSILLGLGASAIAIPLGLLIANTCMSAGWISRLLWLACLSLTFFPLFMHVSAWDSAWGKLGWWTNLNGFSGRAATGWTLAIWIHATAAAPQVAIIFWLGLRAAGRTFEDQAVLDANRGSVFWRVTLPRILPLIGIGVVWILLSCAREIAVTDLYRIGTAAEQVYLGYSLGEFDQPDSAIHNSLTTVVFTSMVGLIAVCLVVLVTTINRLDLMTNGNDQTDRNLRPATVWQTVSGTAVLGLLTIVPTANLVARASKSVTMIDGQATTAYSVAKFLAVLARVSTEYLVEFQWSITIAVISSGLLLVLAVFVSWRAIESRLWAVGLLVSAVIAGLIPGPTIGSSLLGLRTAVDLEWVRWLLDRSVLGPVIANVIFCWPIASLWVWYSLGSTAKDALEHAKIEGAGPAARLFRIVLAANRLAILGCLLILWAISFGELSASQLILPPGMDTIPRLMLGMLHAGVNDDTAGLTIVLAVLIALFSAVGWALVRLNRNRPRR